MFIYWTGYPNLIQIPPSPQCQTKESNINFYLLPLKVPKAGSPEMPCSKRVLLNCTILAQFNQLLYIFKKGSFISFKSYFIMFHSPYCLSAHLKSNVLLSQQCYLLNEEMNKVNKWQYVHNQDFWLRHTFPFKITST